jgi:hypothetical protein
MGGYHSKEMNFILLAEYANRRGEPVDDPTRPVCERRGGGKPFAPILRENRGGDLSISSTPRRAGGGRNTLLCVVSVLFPQLGVMYAGLELAYKQYRFGAVLLLLALASWFMFALLGPSGRFPPFFFRV